MATGDHDYGDAVLDGDLLVIMMVKVRFEVPQTCVAILGSEQYIEEFLDGVVKSVNETEPGTMLYEYYLSEDKKKVSLIEIYKTDADAVIHMKNFLAAPHSGPFLETFEIESFKVMGNSSNELKEILNDFTRDHRKLIRGFKRK